MDVRTWLPYIITEEIFLTNDFIPTVVQENPPEQLITSLRTEAIDPIPPTPKEKSIPEPEPTPKQEPIPPKRCKVLVLLPSLPMSASDETLFKNIFYNPKALALKEQEVVLITSATYEAWKPDYVVALGVEIPGMRLEKYTTMKKETSFLLVDTLESIAQQVDLKKALWLALQQQFLK
ncbi:MAG: hypothetical protein MUF42_09950 [Cytophagaceae bacterium]|nr:hypothetical protein [Cytophagaceae bacterium]